MIKDRTCRPKQILKMTPKIIKNDLNILQLIR